MASGSPTKSPMGASKTKSSCPRMSPIIKIDSSSSFNNPAWGTLPYTTYAVAAIFYTFERTVRACPSFFITGPFKAWILLDHNKRHAYKQ